MTGDDNNICLRCNGVGKQTIGGERIDCPCCGGSGLRNEKSKALVSEPGEYLEVR